MLNISLMSADIPRHRIDYSTTPPWRGGEQSANDFRLSLTSLAYLPTTDVAGSSTIYFVPKGSDYNANAVGRLSIPTYNGQMLTITSPQISIALSGLTTSTVYDLFVYWGNNVLQFDPPLAWSSSTAGASTRATALSSFNGIYVKSTDPSRMYVGSFVASSSNTTYDTGGGSSTYAYRYLYNAYNQVLITANPFYGSTGTPTGNGLFQLYGNGVGIYMVMGLPGRVLFGSAVSSTNVGSGGTTLWGCGLNGSQPSVPYYTSYSAGGVFIPVAAPTGSVLMLGYNKLEGWWSATNAAVTNYVYPSVSASWMG